MSTLRYRLAEQIHFTAGNPDNPSQDLVVTLQRWQSKTSGTQVYVRLHDGAEKTRGLADTVQLRARIDASFESARSDFPLLSDDAAADQVARNGGPKIQWCHAIRDCGAQIPYAAGQCADGHPVAYTPAGTYSHGSSRRPAITVITGGKK